MPRGSCRIWQKCHLRKYRQVKGFGSRRCCRFRQLPLVVNPIFFGDMLCLSEEEEALQKLVLERLLTEGPRCACGAEFGNVCSSTPKRHQGPLYADSLVRIC